MPNFNLTDASGVKCIVGHMGADPEIKYTATGKTVAKFRVATNEGKGEQATTRWNYCVAWDQQAEAVMLLKRGQVACIIGKEHTREYNGKSYTDLNAWFVGTELKSEPKQGQHESLPPQQDDSNPPEQEIPF